MDIHHISGGSQRMGILETRMFTERQLETLVLIAVGGIANRGMLTLSIEPSSCDYSRDQNSTFSV